MYFSDLLDEGCVNRLLNDRIEAFEDAVEHINSIETEMGLNAPAGARFVAGFGAVIAKAGADYIESNRHLLTETGSARIDEPAHSVQGTT
jgi:hypothetical protein